MAAGPAGPGGGPPPPPPKPPDYVVEKEWTVYIKNVGGATKSKSVSSTSYVYDGPGRVYHFTVQPEWGDEGKKFLIQPHISLQENKEAKYYHPDYGPSNTALGYNADAAANFAASNLDYDGLVRTFAADAEARKAKFIESRAYDEEDRKYRKKYPWAEVTERWADAQHAAGVDLIIQFSFGDMLIVIERSAKPKPCLIRFGDLEAAVKAPGSLTDYNFAFLSGQFRVVETDSGLRFIRLTKLASARSASFNKDTPEGTLLKRPAWLRDTLLKVPGAIDSCVIDFGFVGRDEGAVIVFELDGSLRQTTKNAVGASGRGVLSAAEFRRNLVPPCVKQIIDTWLPAGPVDDSHLEANAIEAVKTAAKGHHLVRVGTDVWVVPQDAITVAKGDSLKIGLPRYRVIEPYRPRGRKPDPDWIVIQADGADEHYLVPPNVTKTVLQANDSAADGMVLIAKGSGTESDALKKPADLIAFDFDRYGWLNSLAEAVLSPCGSGMLILLSESECLVLDDDSAGYAPGGACFVATSAPGALCFIHPATGEVCAVTAVLPTLTVVRSRFVLRVSGFHVLMNSRRELVVCDLLVTPPADGADLVVVRDDRGFLGFADPESAGYLTCRILMDEGYLVAKVPVALEEALNGFVHQDAESGTLTCYDFHAFGAGPWSADDDGIDRFLRELVADSGTMCVVDGTGEYAGVELIVTLRGEHLLTVANVLYWLRPDECIVTYTGSTEWDDCACVMLVDEFAGNGCDLVLKENGEFRGYAVSGTALVPWTAVLSDTARHSNGGTLRNISCYALVDDVPTEYGLGMFCVVVPPTANILESFIGVVVQVDPTLDEYLEVLARGGKWYLIENADANELTLCTLFEPEQRVLFLPNGQTLGQALQPLRDGDGNLPDAEQQLIGLAKYGHDFHL